MPNEKKPEPRRQLRGPVTDSDGYWEFVVVPKPRYEGDTTFGFHTREQAEKKKSDLEKNGREDVRIIER
jgi:hypothetical protein